VVAHDDEGLDLAEAFGEIARTLLSEDDLQPTLEKIVAVAIEVVDACEHAGITLIERRKVSSPVRSDEIPRIVDRLQEETDQGPCLDAIREHAVFRTGSLQREARWPQFARRAHDETGIESVLAIRLFADGDTMGALNLYSTVQDAFDEHDVAVASVLAAHAAVAMVRARQIRNLESAVESRDIIGQAKGILMARQDITADQAFDMLRRGSQRLNVKVEEVAEGIATPHPAPPTAATGPND
jgi:transcriptional regulator with GAF, ATPase, and Fis domain